MRVENSLYRALTIEEPSAAEDEEFDFPGEFFGNPGENLLLYRGADPLGFIERESFFREASNLSNEFIVSSPLSAIQLPIQGRDDLGLVQRWPNTINPEIMWLPLFWLPERIGFRYVVTDPMVPEGERLETDDEWSIRVVMELMAAGLYDPETGSWLDVLSAYGADIEDPETIIRLGAWLDGGSDPVFDSIDLTGLFVKPEGDEEWALDFAQQISGLAQAAQFASLATRLRERMFVTVASEANLAERIDNVDQIANLVLVLLDGAELPEPAESVVAVAQDAHDTVDELLDGEVEYSAEDAWDSVLGIMEDLDLILGQVEEEYNPYLEAWNSLYEELVGEEELDDDLRV